MTNLYNPTLEVGKKYNHLTVIEFLYRKNGLQYILAGCDCGNKKEVALNSLKSGNTKSCGCKQYVRVIRNEVRRKDPATYDSIHNRWRGMYDRCYNPESKFYYSYGGRGIKICKEWKENFLLFYFWAINNGWESKLQLDRINNDGDYSPSNCRWVTQDVNKRNTTRSRFIIINGKKKIMAEWCRILNMSRNKILRKLRDKEF